MNMYTQSRILARSIIIGAYFMAKYRNQAKAGGVLKTAKNLRKQGVSLDVALLLLARG